MAQFADRSHFGMGIEQGLELGRVAVEQVFHLAVRPAFERMANTLDGRLGAQIAPHGVNGNRGDSCHEPRYSILRKGGGPPEPAELRPW